MGRRIFRHGSGGAQVPALRPFWDGASQGTTPSASRAIRGNQITEPRRNRGLSDPVVGRVVEDADPYDGVRRTHVGADIIRPRGAG